MVSRGQYYVANTIPFSLIDALFYWSNATKPPPEKVFTSTYKSLKGVLPTKQLVLL